MKSGEQLFMADNQVTLLTIGEGAIDPAQRIASGEITETEIADFVEALSGGEYYDAVDERAIPHKCVDGRCECDESVVLGPNAAGGTLSLVVADALTTADYRRGDETAADHAMRLYSELLAAGHDIGGHEDCGAQNKFQPILEYIARRSDDVREVVEGLRVEVDDELHHHIVEKAHQLCSEGYATTGVDLRQAYIETAGEDSVKTLEGTHKEVALVVNTEPATSLNRDRLQQAFGAEIQAFNLDIDGLKKGSEAVSADPHEAHAKFVAALYYNVATAGVLAGPSLRVISR